MPSPKIVFSQQFRLRLIVFASLIVVLSNSLLAQSYFPEVGPQAISQRSLDARSNLHVLSVALQPGFEDLAALAYFRLGRGAKIMSAYLTNGEAGESDVRGEYPHQLAAVRREEAASALRVLGGESYYLNLPDLAAASDTSHIREHWPKDTLQYRLVKLISTFRPDVILIAPDRESRGPSLRWEIFRREVLQAAGRISYPAGGRAPKELFPFARWSVSRVLVDDGTGKGLIFPVADVHPAWKKSYEAIGNEAAERYVSLSVQRGLWHREKRSGYRIDLPSRLKNPRKPDQGLPLAVPASLRPLAQQVDAVSRSVVQSKGSAQVPARSSKVITRLADLLDAVDIRIARSIEYQPAERKLLLQWKEGLENLRLALLGVTVRYTLTETVLTDRQITYLTIDTVTGLSVGGKTEIFFPAVGRAWIVNEALENRLPLTLHEDFRLIVQDAKPYSQPHSQYGLEDNSLGRPFYFFLIHKAARREENFFHRTIVPFQYAPRFSVEVLTPIVRAVPNARLIVRLTNNSRDGVKDELHANDSLVATAQSPFRLNQKGSAHTDTLMLNWTANISDGTYLLPVKIGEDEVARYVARSFRVNVDSTKRIGIIPGVSSSPTFDAVRRLGLKAQVLKLDEQLSGRLAMLDVVLVDRRALTLQKNLPGLKGVLDQFVLRGGHLVILSQDVPTWNAQPLMPAIMLERSLSFSPEMSLALDSLHSSIMSPNNLTNEDWSNWLYRAAFNNVRLTSSADVEVLIKDRATGNPHVVTQRSGKGLATYIDLDLQHQWMNIHAGALRLLANLLAW